MIDEEIANKKYVNKVSEKREIPIFLKEIKKVTVKNVDYLDKYLSEL